MPCWVLDRQFEGAGAGQAVSFEETPVAHVQRSVGPPQVAEHIGTLVAVQHLAEFGEHVFQLGFVRGIYRDELPACSPVCILGVRDQQHLETTQKLERNPPVEAVIRDDGQNLLGVVKARRDMHFPSLRRQLPTDWAKDMPVITLAGRPPVRRRSTTQLEFSRMLDQPGCGVVKICIDQAIRLVAPVHDSPSVDKHYSVIRLPPQANIWRSSVKSRGS